MNALSHGLRAATKVGLLASVAVALTLGLARDGRPADASATAEILVSKSNISPTHAAAVVLMKGGPTESYWVWAKNVDTPTSSFDVRFAYGNSLLTMNALFADGSWLGSTGRIVGCTAALGPTAVLEKNQALVTCNTLLPPPPPGVTGSGRLARVHLTPRMAEGTTVLDLTGSFLIDTPPDPEDQQKIPVKIRSMNVLVARCADFDGNNTVRVGDILYVVGYYFQSHPPADLDNDGTIRVNDILIAVAQYFQDCPTT